MSAGPPGRPKVKIIATDLDGTLLRSDGTVSPRTRDSLRAAFDAGIEVVPATGRPQVVAADVMAELDFVHHWVLSNGAVTWHHGRQETLRGFWFEAEQIASIVEHVRRGLPRAGFALELESTVLYEAGFDLLVPKPPPYPPVDDVVSAVVDDGGKAQKVLVYEPAFEIFELHHLVAEAVGEDAYATYSGLDFVELAASYVTKATALEHLAADLGVTPAEVVAFGDNHNDIAMLSWAGCSYVMGHADEHTKAVADEVIGLNDDDAVATKIDALVAEVLAASPTPRT